jgi:hypothetical protein
MADETLHQPHDKFFRTAFSDLATATSFLCAYLDRNLVALTDWSTLRSEPGSFIDEQMKAFEVDLLFTAKIHGEDTHFYFLCEHQSTEDPAMALRLLIYMTRIWTLEAKSQGVAVKLTPIIPVVVAQDSKVWKTSARFRDLFGLSSGKWNEVHGFTPDFTFRLLQLVELPFESIQGTSDGKMALRVLKAQAVGELLSDYVWDASLLRTVSRELLENFIRYTLNEDVDKEHFWLKLKELPRKDLSPNTMTLAEKIRAEGRDQGRAEGRYEGRLDAAFMMLCASLETRFDFLPEGLREILRQINDVERLEALNRRAIRCASLEEFAAEL